MGFLPWTSAVALGTLILVGAETKQCKQQCREMCKEKPNKCTADANGAECPSDMCAILPYGYPWNPPVEPMYKWCKFSASVARSPGQKVYVGVAVDWLYPNSTFYCGDHEHIITSPPARASFETWHKHEGRRCSNEWQPHDCRSACKNWCRAACNCVWSKGSEPTQYSQYAFKNGWECVRSNAVCSVDCEMSDWAEWEPCSKTCAGGEQLRSRTIVQTELYGGKPCTTNLTEARSCNTHKCPVESGGKCSRGTESANWKCAEEGETCLRADGKAVCTTTDGCICRKVEDAGQCWPTNSNLSEALKCVTEGSTCLNAEQKTGTCSGMDDACVCGKVETNGLCGRIEESGENLPCAHADESCLLANGLAACDKKGNECLCRKVGTDGKCFATARKLQCADGNESCLENTRMEACSTQNEDCICGKVVTDGKCFATEQKLQCAHATESCIKNTRMEACSSQNADCICGKVVTGGKCFATEQKLQCAHATESCLKNTRMEACSSQNADCICGKVEDGGHCWPRNADLREALKCTTEGSVCLKAERKTGSCSAVDDGCVCGKVETNGVCGCTEEAGANLPCANADESCLLADGLAVCDKKGNECLCRKVATDGKCFATEQKLQCADATESCLKNTRMEACSTSNADCICGKVVTDGKCFATEQKLQCAHTTESCLKNTRLEACSTQNADCICGKVANDGSCSGSTTLLTCVDDNTCVKDGGAKCVNAETGCKCKVIYDGICSTTIATKHLDCGDPNHSCLNSAKNKICDAADGCVCANRNFPHCMSTNELNDDYDGIWIRNDDGRRIWLWRRHVWRIWNGRIIWNEWRNGIFNGTYYIATYNIGGCRWDGTIGYDCTDDDGDGWLKGAGCDDMKFLCCAEEIKFE